MTADSQNIIFIGGHRKAGTSMFHDLFDGHKEIATYPSDLTVLYAYFPDFIKNNHSQKELEDRLNLITIEEVRLCYEDADVPLPQPIERLQNDFFSTLETVEDLKNTRLIISSLINAYQKWSNQEDCKYALLKETSLEIYCPELYQWFPKAKVIQTMRDPRDNYAALKAGVKKKYLALGEDENATLSSLIHRLGTSMKMGLINQETYTDQYQVIKFEDLTNKTETTLEKICDWLEIQFSEGLLRPSKIGNPTTGNNFDGQKFLQITNKNVGAWKERICEEEAQIIEFHLGDLMCDYGYELEYSRKSSAKAASNFYKWSNYKYFYSDRFKLQEETS